MTSLPTCLATPLSALSLARAALTVRDVTKAWSEGDADRARFRLRTATFWTAMLGELQAALPPTGTVPGRDPARTAAVTAAVLISACAHRVPTSDDVERELAAALGRIWAQPGPDGPERRRIAQDVRRLATRIPTTGYDAGLAAVVQSCDPRLGDIGVEVRVHAAVSVAATVRSNEESWIVAALI
ncbi:hypothetical protein [Nocardioides pelophilus]|uniref:hypothetical protein n=1 Tax=Nocardioides pelophilus TaxID=2172019 RepID=UPI001600CD8D|nr:hypothetical protein [Nocardioides pelophilus]